MSGFLLAANLKIRQPLGELAAAAEATGAPERHFPGGCRSMAGGAVSQAVHVNATGVTGPDIRFQLSGSRGQRLAEMLLHPHLLRYNQKD